MMCKKKVKGQATIELVIIMPIVIFFLYTLFLNGYKVYSQMAAVNTNYSEGIAVVRRPSQSEQIADRSVAEYALSRNMSGAGMDNTSKLLPLSANESWSQGWGGRMVSVQIDPPSSLWQYFIGRAGGNNQMLSAKIAYPTLPFISIFEE